jgi:myo-inositol 2-dehydrogenase/D-chiro-inositol 1-dehydrogenase
MKFFLERYAEAYRREFDHYMGAIASGTTPLVGGGESVKALALADAASESFRTGRAVRI